MENVQVLGLNVGEAQLESPESLSSVSGGPIPFKCAWGSKRGLEAGPFGVSLGDQLGRRAASTLDRPCWFMLMR